MSDFEIVKKGYNTDEVDSAIENLSERNSFLEEQNRSLTARLAEAESRIAEYRAYENSLRKSIAESKRAAAAMITEAKSRSAKLLDDAREGCGEIIADLDSRIAQKMHTIDVIKANVDTFKSQLFELYSSHIEMVDTLANTAESFEYSPDYEPVAEAVDDFEAGGEPTCEVPEFTDYPEETVFPENTGDDGFDLGSENGIDDDAADDEPLVMTDDEAEASDDVEYDDMFKAPNEAADEADDDMFKTPDEDGFFAPADENENDAADTQPVEKIDDDYFKFLSDFAESDDEESGAVGKDGE